MSPIPFAHVRALCDAAGLDPDDVSVVVITRSRVSFYGPNDSDAIAAVEVEA